jgi:hypothetical protein
MEIVKVIEAKIGEDGRKYFPKIELKDDEKVMAQLKKTKGFVRVSGGAPYKFKDQTLFNTIDKDLIDLVVVRGE